MTVIKRIWTVEKSILSFVTLYIFGLDGLRRRVRLPFCSMCEGREASDCLKILKQGTVATGTI